MELIFNDAKIRQPKHLERCLCYDKFLKGYRCYVYDDISKYWCTQATTEHDPDGENHIVDYADYQVTEWASLQQEPRFPQYDNIVEKVFGAGNLEGWERDEAEMLVALAKEELLKSLQQEQPDNEDIDKVAQELYEHLYELKRRNNVPTDLYNKQEIINLWKAGIEYAYNHPKQEQPEVYLEKAARNVYESWMGGTMNDVRRDMVNLGKVLNARKEK